MVTDKPGASNHFPVETVWPLLATRFGGERKDPIRRTKKRNPGETTPGAFGTSELKSYDWPPDSPSLA